MKRARVKGMAEGRRKEGGDLESLRACLMGCRGGTRASRCSGYGGKDSPVATSLLRCNLVLNCLIRLKNASEI